MAGGDLLVFDSLPSTNRWALASLGQRRHGDVIHALAQTAGRGRFGRHWVSLEGCCLTLSVVLKEFTAERPAEQVTQWAALAVRACLEEYSLAARLKWPNDVLVSGRKIAGILAESDAASSAIVLGIGLNVNLPLDRLSGRELMQPATSMMAEAGREFAISTVRNVLLGHLEAMLSRSQDRVPGSLCDLWRRHDALIDSDVAVVDAKGTATAGRYAGVDRRGRMRINRPDGVEQVFWSGDVSVRRNAD
jgi:BirA family biotin operon repressor/biotin-[acetyl-CoA-carboxylase] ligase